MNKTLFSCTYKKSYSNRRYKMVQRRVNIIPKAPVARILMKAGAKRVSADAVDAFAEVIQDISLKIAEQSAKIAKHSGRKTVHEGDIKLAAK
ncbi:MAG: histone family protein [Candidatus Woesearchaeota archaeon]|nr:histone family protein [Candidatus Woesearchaeota archaeon]